MCAFKKDKHKNVKKKNPDPLVKGKVRNRGSGCGSGSVLKYGTVLARFLLFTVHENYMNPVPHTCETSSAGT
jgi:hypothetical protein